MTRRRRRMGAALVLAAGLALVPAGRAQASAGLDDSSPRASSVLEGAPTEIVLDLDESVEQGFGRVELFDETGEVVALDGFVDSGDATQVVVPISAPSDLGAGVYVVVYRLVGRDAQPAAGAFSFQIGIGDSSQRAVLDLVTSQQPTVGTTRAIGWTFGAMRFLAFAGVVLVLGAWALAAGPGASGSGGPRARVRQLAAVGLVAGVVGTVGSFALQGPRVMGAGVADAFDGSTLGDVAGTRYGVALLVRLALLVLAVLPTAGIGLAGRGNWRGAAGAVAVGILTTFAVAGHPSGGRWPAAGVVLAVAHLGAIAAWLGAVIAVAVDPTEPGARRVSRLADVAIPVVVVTGVLQTWRLLPDADALSGTTFGRTLVAKVAVVVLLVVLAAMARTLLRTLGSGQVRSVVVAEAVFGLALLGVSAGLSSVPPDLRATNVPVVAVVSQSGFTASLTVTPARAGANDVHLTITQPPGVTEPVAAAAMRIGQLANGVPAVSVMLEPEGPDHFSAYGVSMPTAGSWEVDVLVTAASGETVALSTTVDIAAA